MNEIGQNAGIAFLLPHAFAPVTGRSYIVFSFQIDLNHMTTPFTWNSNSKQYLKLSFYTLIVQLF